MAAQAERKLKTSASLPESVWAQPHAVLCCRKQVRQRVLYKLFWRHFGPKSINTKVLNFLGFRKCCPSSLTCQLHWTLPSHLSHQAKWSSNQYSLLLAATSSPKEITPSMGPHFLSACKPQQYKYMPIKWLA